MEDDSLPQWTKYRDPSERNDPFVWASPWDGDPSVSATGGESKKPKQKYKNKTNAYKSHKPDYRRSQSEKLVETYVKRKQKLLVLMRGIPGSGKTFLSKKIIFDGVILSTDEFYYTEDGVYKFDTSKLNAAHRWNHRRARKAMSEGITPIIIDNSNIKQREMTPYAVAALENNYQVEIIEPETRWRYNVDQCAEKSPHSVPMHTIERRLGHLLDVKVTVESLKEVARARLKKTGGGEDDDDVDGDFDF